MWTSVNGYSKNHYLAKPFSPRDFYYESLCGKVIEVSPKDVLGHQPGATCKSCEQRLNEFDDE